MNYRTPPAFFILLALVFSLSGCLGLERNYPEKHYFVLDVSRPKNSPALETGEVLRIRKFQISRRYQGKGLVYRTGDLSFESDFYNEFFVAPAALLTEETRKRLAGAGLFKHVIDAPSQALPEYILEGMVTSLYGDYRIPARPKAVLEVRFFLIQAARAPARIILENQYRREISMTENSPQALVKAWNKALELILSDFEQDIRKKLPAKEMTGSD
ncbi:MAG: hypothetical protein SV487_11690 [Thermodesulfobacteriota bacterium]|nr:hypothetical protein [Thermodesulfobacteriota bacterium]